MLQVALDFIELKRAISVGEDAVNGGADIIELGTPLIKSEGINAVRLFKEKFSTSFIVADMKTIDVGRVEVEMAVKNGADIVTVMSTSHESTIREAVNAARRYGAKVMVDMLGEPDIESAVKKLDILKDIGVDYVCVHTSIDAQMSSQNPLDAVAKISERSEIPVAVAGGVNQEMASLLRGMNIDIVIVGGAIINSSNVEKTTAEFKKILSGHRVAGVKHRRYDLAEVFKAAERVSSPNIADAMHRTGALCEFRYTGNFSSMFGPAFTVRTMNGDWAKPVEAVDMAPPGSVIVIDAGDGDKAIWGELATRSALLKSIAGVVIYGAVRDIESVSEMKLPVFHRHVSPVAGDPKGHGDIGIVLEIEGHKIHPGDFVFGDPNGVVVIPKNIVVDVMNRAVEVHEKEERLMAEIEKGSGLSELLELKRWEVTK